MGSRDRSTKKHPHSEGQGFKPWQTSTSPVNSDAAPFPGKQTTRHHEALGRLEPGARHRLQAPGGFAGPLWEPEAETGWESERLLHRNRARHTTSQRLRGGLQKAPGRKQKRYKEHKTWSNP